MMYSSVKFGLILLFSLFLSIFISGCGDSYFDDKIPPEKLDNNSSSAEDENNQTNGGSVIVGDLEVLFMSPENNSVDQAKNIVAKAYFNKQIDPASLDEDSVFLLDSDTQILVSGDRSVLDSIVVFDPDDDLIASHHYTFVVTEGIQATDGTNLDSPESSNFSVDDYFGLEATFYPVNGQTDVPTSQQIQVFFNEPVNENTLNEFSVILTDSNGSLVTGFINYTDSNNTHLMTFSPYGLLKKSETYTFMLTDQVKAWNGDSLINESSISFTTADQDFTIKAATFSLEPNTVSVDTENSKILDPVLGGLLGLEVDLVGIQGVAEATINSGTLLSSLSPENEEVTIGELYNQDISFAQYLTAIQSQLAQQGDENGVAAISQILNTLPFDQLTQPIALEDVFGVLPEQLSNLNPTEYSSQTGLNTSNSNGFALLQQLNSRLLNPLVANRIIELPLGLPGLLQSGSFVRAMVLQQGTGVQVMEVGDTLYSSQTRAQVNLTVGKDLLGGLLSTLGSVLSALDPLGLLGLSNTIPNILDIPIYLELASSQATLTSLDQNNVTMDVKNGLARVFIGSIDENIFYDSQTQEITPDMFEPVSLINVLGLVKVQIKAFADGTQDVQNLNYIPIDTKQTQNTSAHVGATLDPLLTSLLENLELKVVVLGQDLGLLQKVLDSLVNPLISQLLPVLSPVLNSLSGVLGADTGRADVSLHKLIYQ